MSDVLSRLKRVNKVPVYSVYDECFKTLGRVVEGFDFFEYADVMKDVELPHEGNSYVASYKPLEETKLTKELGMRAFGSMPIEVGYCVGKNSTVNGFEYHKASEINVAITDFMLFLAPVWEIENNSIDVSRGKVFYVPEGCAVELYGTTMHLSPLKTSDEGFKAVVVLPKGINTDLHDKSDEEGEDELLLKRGKWVIAHKDREPLVKQGAHIGLTGENLRLNY